MNRDRFEQLATDIGFKLMDLEPFIESTIEDDPTVFYQKFERTVNDCLNFLETNDDNIITPTEYLVQEYQENPKKVPRSLVLFNFYRYTKGSNILNHDYGNKKSAISWFRRFYGIGQLAETKTSIA